MVSRPILIAIALVMVAAVASGMSMFVIQSIAPVTPSMSEEQRVIREKFFGAGKEPALIEKRQEMRPRW